MAYNPATEEKLYDIGIIGGGPAGMTAAIYSSRAMLNTIIFEKLGAGGQAAVTDHIENYPGFPEGINGFELSQKMEEQARNFGANFEFSEVTEIKKDEGKNCFIIRTNSNRFYSKTLIIATGTTPRKLNVPGEEKFWGHGISSCATCDGALYKDKVVAVVGGGDSALDEGLFLTKFVKKLYIIHRRNELRAVKILQKRAMENPKIEFLLETVVEEILGENRIEKLKLKNVKTNITSLLDIDGLFIYVGLLPNTSFIKDVRKDENGYIITDENLQTNIPGIFAAGDCRVKTLRQIATATGDGALAAYNAEKYIEHLQCQI
ncbi:MAG: thioredoxin-disulfide reductase [Brevinematia bacterium]